MYNFAISIYALVVRLISPFHHKARLLVKGHKETYNKLAQEIDPQSEYIWFHAASLGEFEQGRPIMERIRKEYPSYKILLTFFSPSGYEVRKNCELADVVCYLPFDKKKNVKRFLNLAKPSLAIFIKYEFWYNFMAELGRMNVPTYMVSAIFRPDQIFFKWYGKSYKKMLHIYKSICVQDEKSKQLLKSIGVNNAIVCGDTRFDRVIDIRKNATRLPKIESFVKQNGSEDKSLTLVAGSSWPKDEDIFVEYFNRNPNLKLIIAPHEIHESHLSYIEEIVKRPSIRYSQIADQDLSKYDCLIIDSFGMLSSLYRYGQVAYVGGGFGVGIHNILEAAVYGIPVIFGPNFKKFREAHQMIEAGGAYTIHNDESFFVLMDEFMQYPEILASAGNQAGSYVANNAGVVDRVMKVLDLK